MHSMAIAIDLHLKAHCRPRHRSGLGFKFVARRFERQIVTARFRGWSAFIGLQIEYSLLERTVEQELVPMARELGLGITPWSPLKSGALSGKYTRKTAGQVKGDRGFFLDPFINEKTYALVDELEAVAKAHGSTVARVAIAWLQAQPGVTST